MPIRKGEAWGHAGPPPDDLIVAADDADLARRAVASPGPFRVRSGDLLATVGGSDQVRPESQFLPIDLGWVQLDDRAEQPFVAHVVAHRRWWRGDAFVAMNAAWLGDWYLGPRAHPNDDRLDATFGRLGLRDRLEARRRAPSGTHLPHPALTSRRAATLEWEAPSATPVWVDGVRVGTARRLRCRLETDRFALVV